MKSEKSIVIGLRREVDTAGSKRSPTTASQTDYGFDTSCFAVG